jgi:hypothetical protein
VTVTVEPGATDAVMGENMKFEMVTAFVALAVADAPEVPPPALPAAVPPPPEQADRSRAPAATSTTAPPLSLRTGPRIDQIA